LIFSASTFSDPSAEIYQNVLDGIPMVIAVAVFNVFNPGYLLPKKVKWGSYY
jgi:hypothetical protein